MKVLLVDDDRIVLDGLAEMVDWQSIGAELVGMAQNGAEALRLAHANQPDAVVSDISMPVMDGLELAAHLHAELPEVQILLLTCHDDFEYARRALSYNVREYILKPLTRETIHDLESRLAEWSRIDALKKTHYRTFWNPTMEKEVALALQKQDAGYLDELFSSLRTQIGTVPSMTVDICLRLLNILYHHRVSLRADAQALEQSHRRAVEEVLALGRREDKLDFVFQKYCAQLEQGAPGKSFNPEGTAAKARQLLDQQYADPNFSLSRLAEQLRVTPSWLSTIFRQQTGDTINNYLITLRIERAKELLAQRETTIAEVSEIAGYADPNYFAKLFRKRVGVTPTQYRNMVTRANGML